MITTLIYRDHKFAARNPPVESLAALRAEPNVMMWVDLSAPTDEEVKHTLETLFGFHALAIEDCVSDSPFPKLESYDDYLYLVLHSVEYTPEKSIQATELDLFLGRNYLVTYHREPMKLVETAFGRALKNPTTLVRGPDRFAHTLLDLMMETYKPVLESLRKQIEVLEEGVLGEIAAKDLFPRVVALRKQLSRLKQIVRPQRDIALQLGQGKQPLIRSVIAPYLRDVGQELARIENQTALWAEQLILTFRLYLSKSGHEANAGIRVLTGITALTFPSLVISGWYGMNFDRMHELPSHLGYPLAAAVTLITTLATYYFMRRRRWL